MTTSIRGIRQFDSVATFQKARWPRISPEWRYYLECYRESQWKVVATVLASIAVSLLSLPLILLVKYIFDRVLPHKDFLGLFLCGAALVALSAVSSAALLWIRWTALGVGEHVTMVLRSRLVERLYELPREFFAKGDRMALHNIVVQDTQRVNQMGNTLIEQVLPAVLISIAVMGFLLSVYWPLVLAVLTVTAIMIWVDRAVGSRVKGYVNQFRRSFEEFSKGAHFVLQAMDLTRINVAEQIEAANQKKILDRLRVSSTIMSWFDTLYDQTHGTFMTAVGLIILVVGGAAVAERKISLGSLLSFYVAARMLSGQMQLMLSKFPQIVLGNEALRDVHRLLSRPEREPYDGSQQIEFRGDLALEAVSFAYQGGRRVLDDAWVKVKPHSTVGLMGPNGAGKTTIISIVCGFYRPQNGRVLADGHEYERLDVHELRRNFGVVPQEPFLFPATIRENIAYGRPSAKMSEIQRAAELATAHSFIAATEKGYETPIGDGGMMLSGGQRQKVALARALLGQPKLLILDEPTNHLDAASISQFIANIKNLPHRPSILLVSHDKSILQWTDEVYKVQDGLVAPSVNSLKEWETTLQGNPKDSSTARYGCKAGPVL
jgi:ABC-type bacteriocin/lantibiotic exporter with double-glycine peptidase domain